MPGIREGREERVLHAVFLVTIEDLRWLFRLERDLPELRVSPDGMFRHVHDELLRFLETGVPMDDHTRAVLEQWMDIDRHWLSLFREKIKEKGYPLTRVIQRRVSNRFFGSELFYMWDPESLINKAEQLAPFKWKMHSEYTLPYEHEDAKCYWSQDEKDVFFFFANSDLETFLRADNISDIDIIYPKRFWEMRKTAEYFHRSDDTWMPYATAKFFEACLRNDYIWWQVLERELERIYIITTSLRVFGRRLYNLRNLGNVVDKLQKCIIHEEEMKREASIYAGHLWRGIEKIAYEEEAERQGFTGPDKVKRYLEWKEKQTQKENTFLGVLVGVGDQNLIEDWVESYYVAEREYPGTWRGLDAVDRVLVDYGYDFSDKQEHRGYRLKPSGKWVYTANMVYNRNEVYRWPEEERLFPTNNYELDRDLIVEVLKHRGWRFGAKGWEKL